MSRKLSIDTYIPTFAAIKQFIAQNGYAPTIRELVNLTDFHSTSVISNHLRRLEEMGYIKHRGFMARTIVILKDIEDEKEG